MSCLSFNMALYLAFCTGIGDLNRNVRHNVKQHNIDRMAVDYLNLILTNVV